MPALYRPRNLRMGTDKNNIYEKTLKVVKRDHPSRIFLAYQPSDDCSSEIETLDWSVLRSIL